MLNWEGFCRKWLSHDLRYYLEFSWDLKETTQDLSIVGLQAEV
jgi:hypothetical protein